MATNTDINTMHSIAKHYGGKCLSGAYKDEHSMLEWMCEKGHRWESAYKVVNQGGWCMQCLKKQKSKEESLEKMKALAISRGGKCLSTEYISMQHKLDWQCAEGHKWSVTPTPVFYGGTWCRKCGYKKNGENARGNIKTMQQLAIKKGGKCLSEKYVDCNVKLEFECSEGHRWMATPSMISSGRWCRKCGTKKTALAHLGSIDMYRKIAEQHGGKLLTETFTGGVAKMLWQCDKGHQWYAQGAHIKNSGSWCPKCAGSLPITLQDMINDANKRGGECLSDTFINSDTKLQFKCAEGHIWMAKPSIIHSGRWCRLCGIKRTAEKAKDSIEMFIEIAEKNGGKCLSVEYVNNNTKLNFECAKGHKWEATPNSIKNQKSWCLVCSYTELGIKSRDPIQIYFDIAKKHGGKCLTTDYAGNHKKMEWECAVGHKWKATGSSVKQGGWCATCAHIRTGDLKRDSLDTYIKIASARGGKCLSTEYINSNTKLEFECAVGHTWKVVPTTVKFLGGWCKICKAEEKKSAKKQN